jgi:AcrR family transcriptional regulator
MASPSTASRPSSRRHRAIPAPASRFDRRLAEIITHATEVFCEKGYEGASMRDLSRASGMSLAGLYYYFESKERLLFLIQRHTFSTIVQRLKGRLEGVIDHKRARGLEFSTRIAVLSLFGMMNWIYTWHNPRVDADAEHLAGEMGDIFLGGVSRGNKNREKIPARK